MTATEELRRMLDERGVEWGCTDLRTGKESANITEWTVPDDGWVTARELGGYIAYTWYMGEKPTPEQAIEATLGRGTCRITVQDNLAETEGMGDVWLECDECHWQMPLEPSTPRFNYCPNCGREVVDA